MRWGLMCNILCLGLLSSSLLLLVVTQYFGHCILQPSSGVPCLSKHRNDSTRKIIFKVWLGLLKRSTWPNICAAYLRRRLFQSEKSHTKCPWWNGYRSRKWTRRHEFKSWTRRIAFHIALIPLGKVWIQLFSLQLWVNSRADCVLQPWRGN